MKNDYSMLLLLLLHGPKRVCQKISASEKRNRYFVSIDHFGVSIVDGWCSCVFFSFFSLFGCSCARVLQLKGGDYCSHIFDRQCGQPQHCWCARSCWPANHRDSATISHTFLLLYLFLFLIHFLWFDTFVEMKIVP